MDGNLMRYNDGSGTRVPRVDRPVARDAKKVHDEVRLAAFKADGALALGGHIMEGVVGLDETRRNLAKDDPVLNALLADIEQTALFAAKKVQKNLFNDFGV